MILVQYSFVRDGVIIEMKTIMSATVNTLIWRVFLASCGSGRIYILPAKTKRSAAINVVKMEVYPELS